MIIMFMNYVIKFLFWLLLMCIMFVIFFFFIVVRLFLRRDVNCDMLLSVFVGYNMLLDILLLIVMMKGGVFWCCKVLMM